MFEHLRLVRSDVLHDYMVNTELLIKHGNEAFAAMVRDGSLENRESRFSKPWALYHSWKPGAVELTTEEADGIRRLLEGGSPTPDQAQLVGMLQHNRWCGDDSPIDLDELVNRSRDIFIAIQNRYELRTFLDRVVELNPQVVVEIGTARGGVLFCLSQIAPRDATLVSIDLPDAPNCGGQTEAERELFATFGPPTQDIQFIPSDSQLPQTRGRLVEILDGKPVDLLFIDGDHSYDGCMSDFGMYHDLVAEDGMIVFHDTCTFPDVWGENAGVGLVWQELSKKYGGEDIVDPDGVSRPNLEPGERWAWGIGILRARDIA